MIYPYFIVDLGWSTKRLSMYWDPRVSSVVIISPNKNMFVHRIHPLFRHTHRYTQLCFYCSFLLAIWRYAVIEGSLEVKLPTICRDGKAEVGRVREEKSRSEKIREGESQKREDAGARKGREVAIHCVFPMIWGSGGSKSNLAKAAGAEPAGQMRD